LIEVKIYCVGENNVCPLKNAFATDVADIFF
jgi:hypothetical protein